MPPPWMGLAAGVGILVVVVGAATQPASATPAPAPVPSHSSSWRVDVFGRNPKVTIGGKSFSPMDPDDLTQLGENIFVNYQNGVGPQGEPAANGTKFSTIIEYSRTGCILGYWELTGKSDGLTADPATGQVIATLNEDANSGLATIDPDAKQGRQVTLYTYSPANPLPHGGGTDAIAIYHGQILISASAPGTVTVPGVIPATAPAVYQAKLTRTGPGVGTATLSPLYFDASTAAVANTSAPTDSATSPNPAAYASVPARGTTVKLALTDPDSNEVIPAASPRFGGDFVLDSQGDQQLIFDKPTSEGPKLSVLYLSQSIDDTGYISAPGGALYLTDASANDVVRLSGNLRPGQVFVAATPGDADNPITANNYLAALDLSTGTVTAVPGLAQLQPKGLIFSPDRR